jgi:hypothetical protein
LKRLAILVACAAGVLVASSVHGAGPKTIRTGTLKMTGKRFNPKQIRPAQLRMTGKRFSPRQIQVAPLKMTGRRE